LQGYNIILQSCSWGRGRGVKFRDGNGVLADVHEVNLEIKVNIMFYRNVLQKYKWSKD